MPVTVISLKWLIGHHDTNLFLKNQDPVGFEPLAASNLQINSKLTITPQRQLWVGYTKKSVSSLQSCLTGSIWIHLIHLIQRI